MKVFEIKIDENLSEKTVKDILFGHLKLTAGLVTALKKGEGIAVNGEHATVRRIVKIGDVLTVTLLSEKSANIVPNDIPIDVLYEDEDILAVNKPSNMPTHPSIGHYEGTLANAVVHYFKDTDFMFRAVNRLDRDTTGIVLIAKNRFSAYWLNEQIKNKEIQKVYNAICCGEFEKSEGIVEAPIKREDKSIIKRIVSSDGQYAKTEYRVIKNEKGFSFAELIPYTGRTHQLRVHMAYIGNPIYGDFIYGEEIKGERTRLHCRSMKFCRLSDKKMIEIKAPLPRDFFIS